MVGGGWWAVGGGRWAVGGTSETGRVYRAEPTHINFAVGVAICSPASREEHDKLRIGSSVKAEFLTRLNFANQVGNDADGGRGGFIVEHAGIWVPGPVVEVISTK